MKWTDPAQGIDLTNCDREPIHLLGAIQPIGFLLAVNTDWMIARVSANFADFFGKKPEEVIGKPALSVLFPEAIHAIRNRLALTFGAITLVALAGSYLYVVPRLESRLTNEKRRCLATAPSGYSEPLAGALGGGACPRACDRRGGGGIDSGSRGSYVDSLDERRRLRPRVVWLTLALPLCGSSHSEVVTRLKQPRWFR